MIWNLNRVLLAQVLEWGNSRICYGGNVKSVSTNLIKLLVILLSAGMTACAKKSSYITSAPSSQKEAGVIVQLSDDQLGKLESSSPNAEIRILSEKHGLFEVRNVTEAELGKLNPKHLERNVYIDNLIKPANSAQNFALKKTKKMNLAKDATPTPAAPVAPALPFNIPNATPFGECVKNAATAPTIAVDSPSPFAESGVPTIMLGQEVKLTASGSTPNAINPSSKLRYIWRAEMDPKVGLMSFPELSNMKPFLNEGSGVTLTPDMVGTYTLILLVQDDKNVCAGLPVTFIVTDNPVFNTELAKQPAKTVDLKFFPHLQAIGASAAWDKNIKGEGRIVAVIDTGVNFNHPGIIKNIFIDEKEVSRDNVDSDGNKLVDDFMGWDFVNGDNTPFDDQGHGSHVSGLTASSAMGVAPKAKILPVKALNGFGGGDIASIAAAIFYAADKGAHIINMSLGGNFKEHEIIQKAVNYAESKGVLMVIAAGNGNEKGEGYDVDDATTEDIFPAEFTNANLLVVAATDLQGKLTSYSNFGPKSVDLAAPGGDFEKPLFSLATANPKNIPFVPSQGTSMASPVVAGAAALIWSANPKLTAEQVKDILLNSATKSDALKGKISSEGNLSVESALKSIPLAQLASH